jgi:hypothetical protein
VQLHLVVGAETEVVVLVLRRGVHPAPLIAAERPLFVVVGDDVLAQLGTDGLEPVPEVTDDGEVSEDRVLPLQQVVGDDRAQDDGQSGEQPHRAIVRCPDAVLSADALAGDGTFTCLAKTGRAGQPIAIHRAHEDDLEHPTVVRQRPRDAKAVGLLSLDGAAQRKLA